MGRDRQEVTTVLEKYKNKGFIPNEFDCFIFTNSFWKDFYGFEYAPHILGKYHLGTTTKEFKEMIGHETVSDALDSILKPTGKYPPRGALVKTGNKDFFRMRLGICVGDKVGYISKSGLLYEGLGSITQSWINKD